MRRSPTELFSPTFLHLYPCTCNMPDTYRGEDWMLPANLEDGSAFEARRSPRCNCVMESFRWALHILLSCVNKHMRQSLVKCQRSGGLPHGFVVISITGLGRSHGPDVTAFDMREQKPFAGLLVFRKATIRRGTRVL